MTLKRWNFLTQPILKSSSKGSFSKKNCPNRTFRSDFTNLRSEILYLFLPENGRFLCFLLQFQIVQFWQTFFLIEGLDELRKILSGKKIFGDFPTWQATPMPKYGQILTFDRKVVETPSWSQNDCHWILGTFDHWSVMLKCFLNWLIGQLVIISAKNQLFVGSC